MKNRFNSSLSIISIALFAFALICFVISTISANTIYRSVVANDTAIGDFTTRPLVSIPMLLAAISVITCLITGLVSIIRFKERSPWLIIPVIISSILVIMVISELIFQH